MTLPRRWSVRSAQPEAQCSHDRRRGDQVERAGAEAVRRGGQRADRADLDRVAGEVGLERLLLVDADLLQGTALDQRDERVTGDLLGEAGAAGAQHAALAVEQHLRGDVDRLGEGPLGAVSAKRDSPRPLDIAWFCSGHSPPLSQTGQSSGWLIEQELHDALLRLVGDLGGDLGAARPCPSETASVQEACGLPIEASSPLRGAHTSTRHWRQAPTGASSGWSQNRGIWTPICSAARITSESLGTETSTSSMVSVTRSVFCT